MGKYTNLPVYKLLGGKVKDKIPAYANGWYTVERDPNQFAEAAQRVVDKGYIGMKFDPFGNGDLELTRKEFHKSMDLIDAVASVAGSKAQIMLELHGRFSPHQAREIANYVEKYEPAWLEEPTRPGDLPALKSVRQHTRLPIATGERLATKYEFSKILQSKAASVLQMNLGRVGGILEAKKIAGLAETHYAQIAPHLYCGPIVGAANIQISACCPNFLILEGVKEYSLMFAADAPLGNT